MPGASARRPLTPHHATPTPTAPPTAASTVLAHYSGWLTNGTQFDSSWDRGAPTSFGLSRVVLKPKLRLPWLRLYTIGSIKPLKIFKRETQELR